MQKRELINFEQLSNILNRSPSWLRKNLASLIKDKQFPEAVPGFKNLWDIKSVELWLDRQIPTYLQANDNQISSNHWSRLLSANAARL